MKDKIGLLVPVIAASIIVSCQTADVPVEIPPQEAYQPVEFARAMAASLPDSTNVVFELDPDGDGVYQIRVVYRERSGLWDVSNSGLMRVTFEPQDTTRVVTTQYGRLFIDLFADATRDNVLDLRMYAEFGLAYGDSVLTLPNTVTWESPHGTWYYVPFDSI